VVNGVIVYEDSPLVVAAREGHILVIDEADKAPLEVVCVLKGLIDGDMSLSDGRKLVSASLLLKQKKKSDHNRIIPIHPNFRMIVLANRPG